MRPVVSGTGAAVRRRFKTKVRAVQAAMVKVFPTQGMKRATEAAVMRRLLAPVPKLQERNKRDETKKK